LKVEDKIGIGVDGARIDERVIGHNLTGQDGVGWGVLIWIAPQHHLESNDVALARARQVGGLHAKPGIERQGIIFRIILIRIGSDDILLSGIAYILIKMNQPLLHVTRAVDTFVANPGVVILNTRIWFIYLLPHHVGVIEVLSIGIARVLIRTPLVVQIRLVYTPLPFAVGEINTPDQVQALRGVVKIGSGQIARIDGIEPGVLNLSKIFVIVTGSVLVIGTPPT